MNPLPFILGPDFISVISNGVPHTIYSNDGRFSKLKTAIKEKNWDTVPQIISLPRAIALFSSGNIQVFEGQVVYKDRPVHNSITERILEFIREGFPFEPLVRFMDKLMENPSERSREQLYNYLNLYMLPICDDGDFIAQKSVTNDYKDHHTKTVDNSVGRIIEMPREKVDENPNASCSFGYHVGNSGYVSTFCSGRVILCKVNPKDVCSIPHDNSCEKMRVCRYEVIGDVGQNGTEKPFTSNYAPDSEVTNEIINKNEPVAQENKDDSGSVISSDRAYKIHKEGVFDLISMEYIKDSGIDELIYPSENLPRSFFRKYKDWKIAR
jgi:hypothetical protein